MYKIIITILGLFVLSSVSAVAAERTREIPKAHAEAIASIVQPLWPQTSLQQDMDGYVLVLAGGQVPLWKDVNIAVDLLSLKIWRMGDGSFLLTSDLPDNLLIYDDMGDLNGSLKSKGASFNARIVIGKDKKEFIISTPLPQAEIIKHDSGKITHIEQGVLQIGLIDRKGLWQFEIDYTGKTLSSENIDRKDKEDQFKWDRPKISLVMKDINLAQYARRSREIKNVQANLKLAEQSGVRIGMLRDSIGGVTLSAKGKRWEHRKAKNDPLKIANGFAMKFDFLDLMTQSAKLNLALSYDHYAVLPQGDTPWKIPQKFDVALSLKQIPVDEFAKLLSDYMTKLSYEDRFDATSSFKKDLWQVLGKIGAEFSIDHGYLFFAGMDLDAKIEQASGHFNASTERGYSGNFKVSLSDPSDAADKVLASGDSILPSYDGATTSFLLNRLADLGRKSSSDRYSYTIDINQDGSVVCNQEDISNRVEGVLNLER